MHHTICDLLFKILDPSICLPEQVTQLAPQQYWSVQSSVPQLALTSEHGEGGGGAYLFNYNLR